MLSRCLLRASSSRNLTCRSLPPCSATGLLQYSPLALSFSTMTVQSPQSTRGPSNNHDGNGKFGHERHPLFVGNIPFSFTRLHFEEFLLDTGVDFATGSRVCFDNRGRSKGFGYVDFVSKEDQSRAKASLQDCIVEGRQLKVDQAVDTRSRRGERGEGGGSSSKSRSRDGTVDYNETVSAVGVGYSRSIFMRNLAFSITRKDIEEFISGELGISADQLRVKLICFQDGRSRGLTQVDFMDSETACRAVQKLNGLLWHDRDIFIQQFVSSSSVRQREEGYNHSNKCTLFLGNLDARSTVDSITDMIHSVMGQNVIDRKIGDSNSRCRDVSFNNSGRSYSDEISDDSNQELVTNVRMGFDKRDPTKFLRYAHVDFVDDDTTFKAAQYLNGLRVELSGAATTGQPFNSSNNNRYSDSSSSGNKLRADISEKKTFTHSNSLSSPSHSSSRSFAPSRSRSKREYNRDQRMGDNDENANRSDIRFSSPRRSRSSDISSSRQGGGDAGAAGDRSYSRSRSGSFSGTSKSSGTPFKSKSRTSNSKREFRSDADYDELYERYNGNGNNSNREGGRRSSNSSSNSSSRRKEEREV